MKTIKFLPVLLLFALVSCNSVRVASDFDKNVEFTQFKTYAFYKNGIDKVEISDLDKKRILRSIDEVMASKGFSKSDNPDILINFFTKSREQVNVNQFGYGFGWGPFWGGHTTAYSDTEGTLYIDFIDARKKEMIWQGQGAGSISENVKDKDEMIKNFVSKILAQYPPEKK